MSWGWALGGHSLVLLPACALLLLPLLPTMMDRLYAFDCELMVFPYSSTQVTIS